MKNINQTNKKEILSYSPDNMAVPGDLQGGKNSRRDERNSLDTLAQPRKSAPIAQSKTTEKGNLNRDYQINPDELLRKRHYKKYLTRQITKHLITLRSKMVPYYRLAHHCNDLIFQRNDELQSMYCNTRACIVCNSIRTAKNINNYEHTFDQEFQNGYFVTLTVPNVNQVALRKTISGMVRNFQLILDNQRKQKNLFHGIRKIEVTYNVDKKNFHPHFHIIIDTKQHAETLIHEWLKAFPFASKKAQDMKQATPGAMKELFKYVTKFTASRASKKKAIEIKALDAIFTALYKMRTFQSFGHIRKVVNEDEDIENRVKIKYENIPQYPFAQWFYEAEENLYVNEEGEILHNWKPRAKMRDWAKNILFSDFSSTGTQGTLFPLDQIAKIYLQN